MLGKGVPEALEGWIVNLLVAAGEAAAAASWPQIRAYDYREYGLNGNRSRFEELYFRRRLMLNDLVLAEWVEGQGRFLDAVIDGLLLISEESGWQLPAHNSYERGGKRLSMADPDDPVVDLFAAETAAILSTTLYLLRDRLDAVDPLVSKRVEREINVRIFKPYINRHFWWMGRGDERMNNWTAWITQNVLLAAFTLPTDETLRRAFLPKALMSLDAFLKDYAEDGACEEGVIYYRHAGLCLHGAMTILDQVAPSAMKPLWQEPKVRNMADYIRHMHVGGDYYFNFADSSAVVPPCGAREYLFGRAVGSEALMGFAAADFVRDENRLMPKEWNLWYRLQAILAASEIMSHERAAPAKADHYFPGIGLAIARDNRFALAVKGGHNGESHNHNDVGSVTLYKDRQPLLIDVGVETYTAKTFSPHRYEIWTMQSAYHNLPSFGGVMQCDGVEFAAQGMDVRFEEEMAEISLDIAGAYPAEAELQSYRRTVRMVRGRTVQMRDEYHGVGPATLSLMTVLEPRTDEGRIWLGNKAEIRLEGAGSITVEPLDITDSRLRQSWPVRLYRLLVPLTGSTLTLTIS
ncbi:heparinase II/III family protein [Rhizobium oryzicola]|uniref:Heparinase II/III family protein n=1 Tax=Rhizobium oryzicola TaxID=1232668 RepID=A0ABT8SY94_9HYPH|nr:heparinase II/III family protein [Rhizobium oryzicola]MDO1582863.1 heparinase II/III family protein [Rhizobium oryzicola]